MTVATREVIAYKLAQVFTNQSPEAQAYTWDYTLYYLPACERAVLCMAEGCPRESYSAFLSPVEALQPQWREKFALAQGEWLLPLLERLPPGQNPVFDEVMEAYRQAHNQLPPTETWNIDPKLCESSPSQRAKHP